MSTDNQDRSPRPTQRVGAARTRGVRDQVPATGIHRRDVHLCEHTVSAVCAESDVELVEFNGEADHVRLLVAYPPALAISVLVQRLKGRTSYAVRRKFIGRCVRARMRVHLWSPSDFAVSCGGAPLSIIKQYIDGQARPL